MTDKNKAELIREAFADKKKGKLLELLRLASERAKLAPKFSKFRAPEPAAYETDDEKLTLKISQALGLVPGALEPEGLARYLVDPSAIKIDSTSIRLPSELERSGYWAVKLERPTQFNVQIELKPHYAHTLATLLSVRPKAESGANLTYADAKPLADDAFKIDGVECVVGARIMIGLENKI